MKLRAFWAALAVVICWYALELLPGPWREWLTGVPAARQEGIALFVTHPCTRCDRVRQLLREHKVEFTEYDVAASETAMQRFDELGGLGVPLLTIQGRVIHGYDERAIRQALRQSSWQ